MLQAKYIPDLEVQDPTGYWEKADMERLSNEHAVMGVLVSSFNKPANEAALLRSIGVEIPEGETVEVLDPKLSSPPPRTNGAKPAAN